MTLNQRGSALRRLQATTCAGADNPSKFPAVKLRGVKRKTTGILARACMALAINLDMLHRIAERGRPNLDREHGNNRGELVKSSNGKESSKAFPRIL